VYGPRDAADVLMSKGRRVARRWEPDGQGRRWVLDGQLVTLAELEDQAEAYGRRIKYRHTPRASGRIAGV
jgi:hypothetical protein